MAAGLYDPGKLKSTDLVTRSYLFKARAQSTACEVSLRSGRSPGVNNTYVERLCRVLLYCSFY